LLVVNGLHDIEEDIWSPKWGLKGKVDASVQVLLQKPGETMPTEHVAPLEIKTGRSVGVMNHRAQTMLYTLLMEDRYGEETSYYASATDSRYTHSCWLAVLLAVGLCPPCRS
jgi:DNA replication ATP-dependent helicase Dna2